MKLKGCFLAINLLLALSPGMGQNLEETRRFADQLFVNGHYSLALSSYHRIAYFDRQKTDPGLLLKIADCYLANNDLNHALEYYDHSYFAENSDSLKVEILFRKSTCYINSHNYALALVELLSLGYVHDNWFHKRLNFYLGMCWFGLGDFPKSLECFLTAANREDQRASIQAIFADPQNLNRPNPKLASWLSIFIPGSGQIYTGEIVDGINSMLLTGTFVALAFYLAVTSSPLDAVLTALPWFQRYYQGGFKRAEEFAKQKRAENRSQTFDRILMVLSSNGTLIP